MKKNSKNKKKFKWVLISLLIVVSVVVIFVTSSIIIICSGTKLDYEKLETKAIGENITYIDASGEKIDTFSEYAAVGDLNDYTKQAFIAKEDKRFYDHKGYDIVRMFGAMKNNLKKGKFVEGASTISQQLVKNKQLGPQKTLQRKVQEVFLARKLESKYDKSEILEMYLNAIYFGNNRYGIENASRFYFNKPAKNLSLSESAMLAGIITAPSNYNPVANKQIAIEKRNLVLALMHQQGFIDEQVMVDSQNEELIINAKNVSNVNEIYLRLARKQACEILGYEELPTNTQIKIHTNLDVDLQITLEEMVASGLYTEQNSNGIMSDIVCVVIDNVSGKVIGYNGSSDFDLTTLRRQPASTIKPIVVYAPAIEQKLISPATFVFDEPINFNGYAPENSAYGYCGWTTIRDSLARSLNVPPVKLLNSMGIDIGKTFAEQMGIEFAENDNNLAIALGGMTNGVTFLELANAYSTFARNGEKIDSQFVNKIYIDGERVFVSEEKTKNPIKVMRESTSYLITDMLEDVVDYGTARQLASLDYDVACKTGTTGAGEKNIDAWNVSYTTKHTVLVWIGNTHGEKGLMNSTTNGSSYPTTFVKRVFEKLYKDKKPDDFVVPETVVEVNLDSSCFENQTLKLATENTPERYITKEVFAIENQPVEYSDNFIELNVPEIWVEFETNPIIKFKSQANVSYEIRRSLINEINEFQLSHDNKFIVKLFGGDLGSNIVLLTTGGEKVDTITGNGRTLSYEDYFEGNGRYEYFVIAYNETHSKISNKVRILK